jgi:FixJ family two-component response regulator
MTNRGEIFVVDDDRAVRDTISVVLTGAGYKVICFADGPALLSVARAQCPICILLDVRIPGKSGIDVLRELRAQDYPAPIMMMSGFGSIATAVDAVRNGAFDFIEKPFAGNDLVARVDEAIRVFRQRQTARPVLQAPMPQMLGREPLTSREREVLGQLSAGITNKVAARHLGISARTVEYHRANIMKKLGVSNAAGLMRSVLAGAATSLDMPAVPGA